MSENQAASTRDSVTLSQAAAHFGISEKTLRKRIHAGVVRAEKLPLNGGGVGWMVFLDGRAGSGMETVPEVGTEQNGSVPELLEAVPEVISTVTEAQRNIAPEVTATRAGSVPEVEARVLAAENEVRVLSEALQRADQATERAERNADQWRNQVEAANRDAAELRIALREALRAMPKQLNAADVELRNATPQTPIAETSPASQPTARREPRPLWKLILGLR
jgi:hypothetical protein